MPRRNLLHRNALPAFIEFLDQHGIEHRDGKGPYEVMQVRWPVTYQAVFRKGHAPEHVSVPNNLLPLVQWFIDARRAEEEAQA